MEFGIDKCKSVHMIRTKFTTLKLAAKIKQMWNSATTVIPKRFSKTALPL